MDVSQFGMGVLIHRLSGNKETVHTHNAAQGKVIAEVVLKNDHLLIRFTDGSGIDTFDDGQSCCESRYMTTGDTLTDFVGATFTGMELREAPNREDKYGEHEVQFLLVNTSTGVFTLETHNEHNGYYGGFAVVIRSWEA